MHPGLPFSFLPFFFDFLFLFVSFFFASTESSLKGHLDGAFTRYSLCGQKRSIQRERIQRESHTCQMAFISAGQAIVRHFSDSGQVASKRD